MNNTNYKQNSAIWLGTILLYVILMHASTIHANDIKTIGYVISQINDFIYRKGTLHKVTDNIITPTESTNTNFDMSQNLSLKYYAQMSGNKHSAPYENTLLPRGCKIRDWGCGMVTAAMVVASYKDPTMDPVKMNAHYASKGYVAGCGGSKLSTTTQAIKDFGIEVGRDIATGDFGGVDEKFKQYIDDGWTFVWAATYTYTGVNTTTKATTTKSMAHIAWIVNIDNAGDVWAYDSVYGRDFNAPINYSDMLRTGYLVNIKPSYATLIRPSSSLK